jgi:hypothetical protein
MLETYSSRTSNPTGDLRACLDQVCDPPDDTNKAACSRRQVQDREYVNNP